jgi:hypothetical protein
MHDPDALPQGDPRLWPAHHGCSIGRHRYLEVVHAGDMLENAVAGGVPDIDPEGEVRLGFHGQVSTRLVLARWCLYPTHVAYASPSRWLH